MMIKSLIIVTMILSTFTLNAEVIAIKAAQFSVKTQNGLAKLEDSLKYPESLLQKFQPQGAKISNKIVSNNQVSFNGTKGYLGMKKTILVKGTLDSVENKVGCSKTEKRYDVTFSFDGSDGLVADNFEMIKIKVCASENSNTSLLVNIQPSLIQGRNYSDFTGSYVQGIIEAQIDPIIKALNEEISSK